MVSFDVTNMYTKIPRDKAIEIIHLYLLSDPILKDRTTVPIGNIIELLKMYATMAYFLETHTTPRHQVSP
jgi:hypothetical protein